ncbi:presenilins-associated rhomboid-like protein, mitochondrial [Macrosteles quadrilineatus]|uniref:presenilins-associated rhomboid-like protein, mitochondrial n=1 Tax=Macrosteles quadrilineatus TaxID=74068 RepID=UPI0023E32754|nr:presenilins-associated rhomboid-like protein, mitochondrial [Macrosteles quadrilineatus]
MSFCVLRTLNFAKDGSWNLCCRYPYQASKLQQTALQLPFNLRNSLKTSKWNFSRGSFGRRAENTFQDEYSFSRLWKPFLFTIGVGGVSITGAAIWQYETARSKNLQTRKIWESWVTPKYGQFRQHMHMWWNSLSAGDKVFAPICFLNVLVYLAWRVPAWQPVMMLYFTSGLAKGAVCWPMLLSTFSHYNIFHLGTNMFVLHSFSEGAVSSLGKEQFVAFYLSAGMVSSFTSYLYRAALRSPVTSLGASGAVMGVLAYVCSRHPNSKLAVIFLPQYPFEASTGLKAIMCMDTVGCIARWSYLDHAAHLGGSLFGVFWHIFGYEYIWKKREPLVTAWHKLRGPL